ncbi:MAG: hypothetical protein GW803_04035 [Caldiserica bacterium]|nr:hypothetical protein [Caldisericota bacterium]
MQTQNSNSNEIQTRLLDTHEDLHSPSKKEESSSIQTENLQEFSTFKQLNIANAPTTLLETIEALENEEAKLPDRKVLIKQMLNFFEKTTNQDCSIVTRISSICVSNQRILELLQILLCNSNQELRALTLLSSVDPEQFSDYEDCIFIAADYFSKNIKKFELLMNIISTTAENGLKGIYPLFSVTLRKLVKINCINEAMQFIDKLISNSIEISNCAINILIDNLCKGNRIEEAQTLLSRLEEYKPEHTFLSGNTNMEFSKLNVNCGVNITTWVIFLKNLFKNQKINLGILYYKKLIQQETFQCDQIFNIVIDGLFKNSKLEEIISVYNDMNIYEVKPSVATFNYIIESLIKNSEIDKAWEYYQRLLDTNQSGDNYTYSTLFRGIRDHSHKVYLQKAFEILDNMTNEGKRIEIILINVLLDSCVFLKEGKIIQNFFKKITTGYYRVEPDTVTLNTYLKGCIHTGYFNEAFMEFENLIDRIPPNDVTFNTILDACVRDNKMNKVNFVMSLMQSHKIKPDNFTYSTIIKGLNKTYESNEKDLQLAFDMFENVKKFSTPDEIFYNCMMDVCLRFDRIDKMLEIYEEMKSKQIKPSSITCGIAIKAYGMNNELDKAIEVYNMMKLNNIERSSVTYGCLINSCIKNNNLEKVFELYNEMDKLGYEMNTILYTTLIKAYAKVKNTKKVFEIFNKMKKDEKNPPNNITFNTVLDYSSKNLDLESSLRIFEEIVNFKNVQPDIISFSTLVKCKQHFHYNLLLFLYNIYFLNRLYQ